MSTLKGIKCIAPIFDASGYAEWSRAYILALAETGIPLTIEAVSFDPGKPTLSPSYDTLKPLVNKKIEYNVAICWSIPPAAAQFLSKENKDIFKVIFTLWETSALHSPWSLFINNYANECWVPGDWNKSVFLNSGITVPIKTFDHPLNLKLYDLPLQSVQLGLENSGVPDSTYCFYFISQWNARKNFKDLLEAYWSTFSSADDVCLVLKTFISDYSETETNLIYKSIESLARTMGLPSVANVVLLANLLSSEEIFALHKRGDCYVSASHGEGLGLGMLEASIFGKPVITNLYGEQSSYFSEETCFKYGHTMRPVTAMNSPYYSCKQSWAQPNVGELASCMRYCYEHKDQSKAKGAKAALTIRNRCKPDSISQEILSSLTKSLTFFG